MKNIWNLWQGKKKSDRKEISLAARLSFELSRLDSFLWQQLVSKHPDDLFAAKAYLSASMNAEYGKNVLLSDELGLINDYVRLWQAIDDTMHIALSIHTEENTFGIPPLILFPLLQNALQSTYFMSEKRPIKCRIRVVDNLLTIEISNRVNPYLKNQAENEVIGLLRDRLQVEYPNMHDLIISSNSNLFRATLQLRLTPTRGDALGDLI